MPCISEARLSCSLLTVGYTVAVNAPVKSGANVLSILGNAVFVSAVNIALHTILVPVVADALSRLKHAGGSVHDPEFCTTRLLSMYTMSFGAHLLLPVFATMVLDEVHSAGT